MTETAIPFRLRDLIAHLAGKIAEPEQRTQFLFFCRLVASIYHDKFRDSQEEWERLYVPFDPDATSLTVPGIATGEAGASPQKIIEGVKQVLLAGNYHEIDAEQLQKAFARASPHGLQIEVDIDDYEELALFYKGEHPESIEARGLLRKKKIEYSVYHHVVLAYKLKHDSHSVKHIKKKGHGKYRTDKVYLKLFKNVPTLDLEMLFPDTDIKVRLFDKTSGAWLKEFSV
ncbi:MAG: DUF3754 domain-containing protein, partial [Rectinemataceae bacterium]